MKRITLALTATIAFSIPMSASAGYVWNPETDGANPHVAATIDTAAILAAFKAKEDKQAADEKALADKREAAAAQMARDAADTQAAKQAARAASPEGISDANRDAKTKAAQAAEAAMTPAQVATRTGKYVASLRAQYGSRVHFESADAERIVRSYNIDCRAKDRRSLPLMNVLYLQLSLSSNKDFWVEKYVEEQGGEIRITDVIRGHPPHIAPPELAFEINRWGELRPVSITTNAIRNSCFGSYGPIWKP
ncbi:hypothetical protein [Caballeronia sp. SBC2]|uniref:hypothetical protein n=1 Tax=Caballeronia sp. SBC2 TaxID=2705547 RepID=UPI0013ED9BE7|nr:hypothetical protein [Caballeronia sp. SBC2]